MNIKMMLFIVLSSLIICYGQTTVNGRFVGNVNNLTLEVTLQINTNTGIDDMGGATIPISFSNSTLSIPNTLVSGVDYVFHNFSGGNYSPATVTKPNPTGLPNQLWINIDLPYYNNNNGTVVSQSPNWTNVVTINFDILNVNGFADVSWLTNSQFWGIYDGNNTTFWQTGQFDNLNNQPLPIELISFTIIEIPDSVLLKWETKTEINSYGFDVEESINNNKNFKKIGFVEGSGNSNSLKEYRFSHSITKNGNYFYRLKLIDNDGSFEYSNIINIELNDVITDYILDLYPNPFNPTITVKFSVKEKQNVTISIYNISGEKIIQKEIKDAEGIYKQLIDFSKYSSGVYIFKVEGNKFLLAKKGLLLK